MKRERERVRRREWGVAAFEKRRERRDDRSIETRRELMRACVHSHRGEETFVHGTRAALAERSCQAVQGAGVVRSTFENKLCDHACL